MKVNCSGVQSPGKTLEMAQTPKVTGSRWAGDAAGRPAKASGSEEAGGRALDVTPPRVTMKELSVQVPISSPQSQLAA